MGHRGGGLQDKLLRVVFQEAFRRSNDVMFYCDRNGVILDVNAAFTEHYGYTRREAVGKTPRILRSRHSTGDLYRRMWADLLDPAKGYWRGEMINRTKGGREIPLVLNITSVRDSRGELVGYMSNAVDLSDQVALQARVTQAEALATLGEMAAVVAHEIRNPLGSIVMASKQLASDALERADREMVLQVLRDESHRLNEALTNFLAFARPREAKFARCDLNALVGEVCNIVRSNVDLIGRIRVCVSCDGALKPFTMDADQIRQVLWNIILNAIQAMDGGGRLKVKTGRARGQAYFSVSDTGPGLPESSVTEIFKPFHTTKKQGTGLGLAIAERIVKTHGGRIEVKSRPGRGAAFTVFLPSSAG